MAGLDAGTLDRRIRFETGTPAKNALNEAVSTFDPLATVWARYAPSAGQERNQAAVEDSSLAATFTTRWSSVLAAIGADTSARIIFDGVIWDIKAVAEIGRRDGLIFTAVTRFDAAS